MASLRARLTLGLLMLCAAGLLAAGAATYAEESSTLQARVDQQARSASATVSRALDNRGFGSSTTGTSSPHGGRGFGRPDGGAGGPDGGFGGPGGPPGANGAGGQAVNLPPGTYGERRDATGRVLGHVSITYGQPAPAYPRLPVRLALDQVTTVGSVGSSGVRYRALANQNPEDTGVTIVAVPLAEVDRTLHRLLAVELLVIAGVLLLVGLGALIVVRIGLRPLVRMGMIADEIAGGELSRRVTPATPASEVGRLGVALNRMLERLEDAFAEREKSERRLRRFLADASHELRTPLASIRGYAELFRMGAANDPKDTSRAMRRIEEEAKRMGVLVEDLLTLARLDEIHAPVRQAADLTKLAGDAVEDSRAVAPDRAISLSADHGVAVIGDPHQLRQVFANLMRNAVVHTPTGSPIEVALRRSGATVEIEVRDHGPGLPSGSNGQLFERFWRSEPGRERGRAGAGLGLAIVAGIVDSHGGRVHAENAAGGGARFVVELPAPPAPPSPAQRHGEWERR